MLNFVIDVLTLLVLLAMVGTGLVIRYLLPPGSGGHGAGPRLELWGLGRHDWGDVHFWIAVATIVVTLIHIVIDWKALRGVIRYLTSAHRGPAVSSK